MLFKAGAEPRGAATGSMRILMIRMYQRSTQPPMSCSRVALGHRASARRHAAHCHRLRECDTLIIDTHYNSYAINELVSFQKHIQLSF